MSSAMFKCLYLSYVLTYGCKKIHVNKSGMITLQLNQLVTRFWLSQIWIHSETRGSFRENWDLEHLNITGKWTLQCLKIQMKWDLMSWLHYIRLFDFPFSFIPWWTIAHFPFSDATPWLKFVKVCRVAMVMIIKQMLGKHLEYFSHRITLQDFN